MSGTAYQLESGLARLLDTFHSRNCFTHTGYRPGTGQATGQANKLAGDLKEGSSQFL